MMDDEERKKKLEAELYDLFLVQDGFTKLLQIISIDDLNTDDVNCVAETGKLLTFVNNEIQLRAKDLVEAREIGTTIPKPKPEELGQMIYAIGDALYHADFNNTDLHPPPPTRFIPDTLIHG